MKDAFISLLDPALVVELNPTTVALLDVTPYDLILLVCNVTLPMTVNTVKRISWEETSPLGMVQMLSHNGFDTNIMNAGLNNSLSTSVLSRYAASAGRWMYTCNASIQVSGDPIISYSQTAEVIVTGMQVLSISKSLHIAS